ncbi:DUF4249 domain-containing protein [Croceitalea dokdonensis]|uniref:DUF4249 domain-containing protein n=1 Tax=Croceitalea dokdonensis TaxID=346188 RepID=UPI0006CA08B5|nr:DUF4249 domain-containing protein [Croceitalea dokdonensis]
MRKPIHISLLTLCICLTSCVEEISVVPLSAVSQDGQGILVVEANLTDNGEPQRVLLSRSRQVESDSTVNVPEQVLFNPNSPFISPKGLDVLPEENASVRVSTNGGPEFVFMESEPGIYVSPADFRPTFDVGYTLSVSTSNGDRYRSNEMRMAGTSSIDSLYAEPTIAGSGAAGVGIFVDSSMDSALGEAAYYRYTFEETYKIIAPNWTPFEFEIIRENQELMVDANGDVIDILYPDVRLVPRAREERVCFKTDASQDILLFDGTTLNGGPVIKNQLRFIKSDNPIISHRYSILVKQMAISFEAFQFYENLRNFNQSELVFSQVQPGPLEGNVFNIAGDQPVIGFFDVSHATERRLYFNYVDFYPDEPLPPYFGTVRCDRILAPILGNPERDGPIPPNASCPALLPGVKLGLLEYVSSNEPGECEGPYIVTPTICGDCNVVGTNVVPDFWIEE